MSRQFPAILKKNSLRRANALKKILFVCQRHRLRVRYADQPRRDYANVSQLVGSSNPENLNAVFINEGIPQAERLVKLNAIAISQMRRLTEDHRLLQLDEAKGAES